jgi:Flp pilus assembly protein TadD
MVYLLVLLSSFWLAQLPNPDLASRLSAEGLKLLDQGRLAEAVDRFRRAVEADPENLAALNNLGVTLRKQKDFATAVATLQRAARLHPEDARVHVNLGLAFQGLNRTSDALA